MSVLVRSPVEQVFGVQAAIEQQRKGRMTVVEHAVVERLAVVGIRAGGEQQPGQCVAGLMRWLVHNTHLAATERPGQRGETVLTAPHVVRVRIRPAFEKQLGNAEG